MPEDINQIIHDHYGFIIKTVSNTLNRYVNVHNDDAFSVALLAFQEAYEKYDDEKGPFLAYAKLAIRSRLIDYMRKEGPHREDLSLDELTEEGFEATDDRHHQQVDYALELEQWQEALKPFGITMEKLVEESPNHEDTRERAIQISEKSSQHPPIVQPLYEKKRLPIKVTAEYNGVTTKVIQRSKTFIISVIVLIKEECRSLMDWIGRGDN